MVAGLMSPAPLQTVCTEPFIASVSPQHPVDDDSGKPYSMCDWTASFCFTLKSYL